MDSNTIKHVISDDTHKLVSSMLIYKMASKVLTKEEIHTVIESCCDNFKNAYTKCLFGSEKVQSKNIANKIIEDTKHNIIDLIDKFK